MTTTPTARIVAIAIACLFAAVAVPRGAAQGAGARPRRQGVLRPRARHHHVARRARRGPADAARTARPGRHSSAGARQGFANGSDIAVWIDPRSGTAVNILGAYPAHPRQRLRQPVSLRSLGARARWTPRWWTPPCAASCDAPRAHPRHRRRAARARRASPRSTTTSGRSTSRRSTSGVPVRHGALVASISHGNLVTIGTDTWGNVAGLVRAPRRSRPRPRSHTGFAYADGRAARGRAPASRPRLEIVPVAVRATSAASAVADAVGAGLRPPPGLDVRVPAPARRRALGGHGRRPQRRGARPAGHQPLRAAPGDGRRLPGDQHRDLPRRR